MAHVKMYSKKDKRFVNFPIACTPSDDECKKCQLMRQSQNQNGGIVMKEIKIKTEE